MDYNNFYLRIFTSIILISIFFITIFYLENYLIYLFCVIYLILFLEIFYNFRKKINFFIIFIIYILISFISIQFYLFKFFDLEKFIYFIFIIIFFDSFSYLMGSFFGKKKILPKLSPNKTYLGFFGGITLTIFFSYIYNYNYKIYSLNNFIIFNSLIIISSFLGDIIESYFKRISSLKNSSLLLPGHGGLLDRLDSFLMSIIIFTLLELILI